jgi:uncharacterized protein (DUF58 family)
VLAACATRSNDKVGLVAFTDAVEHFVPPRKGTRHAGRVIRDVLGFRPMRSGTDLAGTIEHVNRMVRRGSILVVISDFLAPAGWEKAVSRAARRHDVIAVKPHDPREGELPPVGLVRAADLETGEIGEIDASDPRVRDAWKQKWERHRAVVTTTLRRAGADLVDVRTGDDFIAPLRALFAKRSRHRGAPGRASGRSSPRMRLRGESESE